MRNFVLAALLAVTTLGATAQAGLCDRDDWYGHHHYYRSYDYGYDYGNPYGYDYGYINRDRARHIERRLERQAIRNQLGYRVYRYGGWY